MGVIKETKYLPEDEVHGPVSTVALPPTLNTSVIPKDLEYSRVVRVFDGTMNEELKSNGFCPAGVSLS